jgi:hypothetical protein
MSGESLEPLVEELDEQRGGTGVGRAMYRVCDRFLGVALALEPPRLQHPSIGRGVPGEPQARPGALDWLPHRLLLPAPDETFDVLYSKATVPADSVGRDLACLYEAIECALADGEVCGGCITGEHWPHQRHLATPRILALVDGCRHSVSLLRSFPAA